MYSPSVGGADHVCHICRLLCYKPKGCKVGVELMTTDVETLEPGEYLNDKIMDFYLK